MKEIHESNHCCQTEATLPESLTNINSSITDPEKCDLAFTLYLTDLILCRSVPEQLPVLPGTWAAVSLKMSECTHSKNEVENLL